jgi:hypothetical protein
MPDVEDPKGTRIPLSQFAYLETRAPVTKH